MPNFLFLLLSGFLLASQVSYGKDFELPSLNLELSLPGLWNEVESPATVELYRQPVTGQILALRALPPSAANHLEKLPRDLPGFETWVRQISVEEQMLQMAVMLDNLVAYEGDVENSSLTGPLFRAEIMHDQAGRMTVHIWLAWDGNGAYWVQLVSPPSPLTARDTKLQEWVSVLHHQRSVFTEKAHYDFLDSWYQNDSVPGLRVPELSGLHISEGGGPLQFLEAGLPVALTYTNQTLSTIGMVLPVCGIDDWSSDALLKNLVTASFQGIPDVTSVTAGEREFTLVSGHHYLEDLGSVYSQASIANIKPCSVAIILISEEPFEQPQFAAEIASRFQVSESTSEDAILNSYADAEAIADFYLGLAVLMAEEGLASPRLAQIAWKRYPSVGAAVVVLSSFNQHGQYRQARNWLEQISDDVRQDTVVKSWEALFLARTQDFVGSAAAYEQVFASGYPGDEDFFMYLQVLQELQRPEQAWQLLNRFSDQVNQRTSLAVSTMTIAATLDETDAVAEQYDWLNQQQRITSSNIAEILDALYESDQQDLLFALLEKQLEQDPSQADLWYYKGDVLAANGDYDAAFDAMQKAAALLPESAKVQSYLEHIQLNRGAGNYEAFAKPIDPVDLPEAIETPILSASDLNDKADAVFIFNLTGYEFHPGKPIRKTFRSRKKILTRQGINANKTFLYSYDDSYEQIFVNKLEVFDASGKSVATLDPKTVYITNSQDGIEADTDKTLNIPVPYLEVGSTVDIVITTQTLSSQAEFAFEKYFFTAQYAQMLDALYVIGDMEVIQAAAAESVHARSFKTGKVWSVSDTPAFRGGAYMPRMEALVPWVAVVQHAESWQHVASEYLTQISDRLETPFSALKLRAIAGEADDALEKVQAVAAYLQANVQYHALEFGSRALIPNAADQTLSAKFGDCKDHAVLMVDLLHSLDVKAHLALVDTQHELVSELPSLGQFDHMVVYVPDVEEGFFVDTTDKEIGIHPDLPPQSIQGQWSLILDPEAAMLKKVPTLTIDQNALQIDRLVGTDGEYLSITETMELSGYLASQFRFNLKGTDSESLMQSVQSWVNGLFPNLELMRFDYFGLEQNQSPLVIEMQTRIHRNDVSEHLPLFAERSFLDTPRQPNRTFAYAIREPLQISSTTQFEKPLESVLQHQSADAKGQYSGFKWQITQLDEGVRFQAQLGKEQGSASTFDDFVSEIKLALRKLQSAAN